MDVWIIVFAALAIIGGAILSFLGIIGDLKNRQTLGLWILYATILFALTWAFLYFQKRIWDGQSSAGIKHGSGVETPKDNQTTSSEPFSIIGVTELGTDKRNSGSGLWIAHQSRIGRIVLSPIHRAIFIRLTNLQTLRSTIETYRVEVLNEHNVWIKLISITPQRGTVYWGGDLSRARLIDTNQMLDVVIQDKIIIPKETIEGWAFFEIPEDLGLWRPMRIYVKDFGGAETTKDISITRTQGFIQYPNLDFSGVWLDLRKYIQAYYSEVTAK